MIWPYGFAVFGVVCAVVLLVMAILFIMQISRDGWNN